MKVEIIWSFRSCLSFHDDGAVDEDVGDAADDHRHQEGQAHDDEDEQLLGFRHRLEANENNIEKVCKISSTKLVSRSYYTIGSHSPQYYYKIGFTRVSIYSVDLSTELHPW